MTALTNIKSISNRLKNFLLATAFVATQVVAPLTLSGVASAVQGNPTPPGNNGTLKVHEKGTDSGTESNDPKVCAFNFEGFGFDVGQEGYIRIDGQGQTQGSYGDYSFGPTTPDAQHTSYAQSQYFNDGGVTIPDGQYKATLYGKDTGGSIDLQDEKAKSKVFKVQCEQPVVKPCEVYTSAGEVRPSNLMGFDFSETRATGHYEFTQDGLHIWTEGTTSTDKVAAYKSVNVPLTDVGDPSLDYTSNFGITPGYQLVMDFDNNGTPDGILVGETIYGSNWWLTNGAAQFAKDGAPHTGGGNGSNWFGTLNEWLAAFPDAHVLGFGFSLGSGVHADGVLKSITFNCGVYTFTNDKGQISITKDAQPNSLQDFSFTATGTGLSDFTLDDDYGVIGKDNTNNKTKDFDSLAAGTYTVTENVTPGWYLDSVMCNERSSTSVDGRSVTINLRADEHVSCTFVNKRLTKIIVHKVTDPWGDQTNFPVSIHADSGEVVGATTGSISSGSDASFWAKPGTYDVDEGSVAGWKQTRTTCQNLVVSGDHSTKECTIYNQKLTGLTIIKDAQPDSSKDFHFAISKLPFFGPPQYLSSFTLDDDGNASNTHSNQQTFTDLSSGWYVISEQHEQGWTLASITCSEGTQYNRVLGSLFVKVDSHKMPSCTFVNKRDMAQIKVIKNLVPGTDPGLFNFNLGDNNVGDNLGAEKPTDGYVAVPTGTYDLTETAANETTTTSDYYTWYVCSYDNDIFEQNNPERNSNIMGLFSPQNQKENENLTWNEHSFWGKGTTIENVKLNKNDKLTCTFTNKRIPKITIVKDAQPDSTQAFTFDTNFSEDFSLTDDGTLSGSQSKTFKDKIHANHEYTFKEQYTKGWALSDISCTGSEEGWSVSEDGTLTVNPQSGDDVVCTFTNQKEAHVTIIKDAQPNSSQPFTFTSNLSGEDSMFALTDNGSNADLAKEVFSSVAPGTYTVSESSLVGWKLSSIDCGENAEFSAVNNVLTLNVKAGDDITCTFVNTKKPAGHVLGASTTVPSGQLPNTGNNPLLNFIAGTALILLALGARWFGRKSQTAAL